jgi:hypothetical protein
MKKHILLGLILGLVSSVAAVASLVPVGIIPSGGQGLGAVNTSLTFTSPGSSSDEQGCVGSNSSGNTVTGSTKCPAGITGGNEQAINNVFSATNLGIQAGNANGFSFSDLLVLFNADEPQNAGGKSITINNLALTLFDATGTLQRSYFITSPFTFTDTPGVGNAGAGFMLDSTQAANANAFLAANPNLRIGTAAIASAATGGPETISLSTYRPVPEPRWTAVGLVLLSIALLGFRKRVLQN